MNGQTLYGATDFYRPFPDPNDVFASNIPEHCEYLLPVGTLSLSHVSPDWSGCIHYIVPIEPVGGWGALGDKSTAYHNHLCRPDWLGYRLLGDQCELLCDFHFFHKAYYSVHPPGSDFEKREAAELPTHYARTRQEFSAIRTHFQKHGTLSK